MPQWQRQILLLLKLRYFVHLKKSEIDLKQASFIPSFTIQTIFTIEKKD